MKHYLLTQIQSKAMKQQVSEHPDGPSIYHKWTASGNTSSVMSQPADPKVTGLESASAQSPQARVKYGQCYACGSHLKEHD